MRRLLPIVALGLLAPSASAEAASFPLGDGQNPGVAVDGTGTAYVGWQTAAHAVQLCVLPTTRARGATRVGARRYDLNRARSRVAVRLRPRSGRAKTLRLRLHRCG